jgi:hypothetical protein
MSATNAPRYLPTLTEVVSPEVVLQPVQAQVAQAEPWAGTPHPAMDPGETDAITQNVLSKITPLLEQQLRSSAQELFEVQISVVLPALHRHIEAAVRQAIHETLSERGDQR